MNKLALMMSILMFGNGISAAGLEVLQPAAEEMAVQESTESVERSDEQLEEAEVEETSESLEEITASSEEDVEVSSTTVEEQTETTDSSNEKKDTSAKAAVYAEALQAEDGYWLVGDAATLKTYIGTDKKNNIRLTADIDIGSTGLALYNSFVLDGAGHTITYNKAGSTAAGFYLQETNATVTMKNLNFGLADGSGATGYYGIITGFDAYPNMTMIFENINYTTNNGQPLYNLNGQIIFKGNNSFNQTGSSTYSQEWAETNYIEVESGTTKVVHNTTNMYGFIYAHGTNTNSPYASSANVVVRSGASFDVETGHAFFYSGSASYDQSIIVEDNAALAVKQTGTEATRKRFIYPNLGTGAATDFRFGVNSAVQLDLKIPMPLYNSRGGMTIGENAAYEMNVEEGNMFSVSTSGTFSMDIDRVQKAAFNGTAAGTLGIRSSSTSVANLSYRGTNRMKVAAYSSETAELPSAAFNKTETALSATNTTYQNVSGEALSTAELNALATSKRLVFSSVWVPEILSTAVTNESSQSAVLSVTSENRSFPATEATYFLFTNEGDTGTLEKAKHIYTMTDLSQQTEGTYQFEATDLNPNTTYWLQARVTNENGQSDWSQPITFSTDPDLQSLGIENEEDLTETTAKISGILANNTGFWTDFSNGQENPIFNQAADFGASYSDAVIQMEYSKNSDFSEAETTLVEQRFGPNDSQFSEELTNLRPSTTYYVRVKVTGISGREILFPFVYTFETKYGEYIDVSIPVEMIFATDDKEAGTENAGTIHSKDESYEIKNQGNVDTAVHVTGFTPENEAAKEIELLTDMNGQAASDQLALKLLARGTVMTETFLSQEIQTEPKLLGTMNTSDANILQLDFSGKFFNPLGKVLLPSYTLTLKFEKAE
ncbi:hypothetical protein [Enterococcus larvae]|uniref:hypothetical protein n=1 Tax=Enterococcus larvae TaxID=2794352 RepID=UPI003F33A9F1